MCVGRPVRLYYCAVSVTTPRPAMLADQNTPHTATSMPCLGITAQRITTGAVVVARDGLGTGTHINTSPQPQHTKRGSSRVPMPSQGPWIIRPLLSHRKNWVWYLYLFVHTDGHSTVTQYVNDLAKLVPVSPMEEIPHGRTCEDADHGIVRLCPSLARVCAIF